MEGSNVPFTPDQVAELGRITFSRGLITPLAAFFIGTCITAFIFVQVRDAVVQLSADATEAQLNEATKNIEFATKGFAETIEATAALAQQSAAMTRRQFEIFLQTAGYLEAFPGITGISYVQRVPAANLDAFVHAVRLDTSLKPEGYPEFAVRPASSTASEFWVYTYVHSSATYQVAMGLDANGDAERRVWGTSARDTGTTATAIIHSLSGDQLPGIIVAKPIYATHDTPRTLAERRKLLTGFISVSMRLQLYFPTLLQGANAAKNIDIVVTDNGTASIPATTSLYTVNANRSPSPLARVLYPRIVLHRPSTFFDRTWDITVTAPPGFGLGTLSQWAPVGALGIGMLASFIIALLVYIARFFTRAESLQKENQLLKDEYEFIRVISHQLRTPINAVRWSMEVLREQSPTPAVFDPLLAKVGDVSEAISNLLYFHEITERRALGEEASTVSLGAIAQEVMIAHTEQAAARGIVIKLDQPRTDSVVVSSPKALHKAIDCILDNAIRYSPDKGAITMVITSIERLVELAITNHGSYIPEAEQLHLFTPFFRGNAAKRAGVFGIGIGLALTRTIIELLGGTIRYASTPEQGTTIAFSIPIDSR